MFRKATAIAIVGYVTFVQSAYAQDSHYIKDDQISKQQIIDLLVPKPSYKTRGLSASSVPKTAISMAIEFSYDSAELTAASRAKLVALGEALNSEQLSNFKFKIDGHTDASGNDFYNLELSKKRALTVGAYLYQEHAVDINRLVLTGKGEAELYDPSNPNSGINRRVEIGTIVD